MGSPRSRGSPRGRCFEIASAIEGLVGANLTQSPMPLSEEMRSTMVVSSRQQLLLCTGVFFKYYLPRGTRGYELNATRINAFPNRYPILPYPAQLD